MNRFFISTPLGFEQQSLFEMQQIWPQLLGKDARTHSFPFPDVSILEGGLEFEADLFVVLQLNFFLKTAHRVLLRMSSFKARDLPKFYQKFRSLPWGEYLNSSVVDWEVAAQKSRLNNEKRLQLSAQEALREILPALEAAPRATIYIRMDDDLCTISLDTTGEHLHKRGWSQLRGEAPLRETIAAACLVELKKGTPPSELEKITLLDPMMGSGTFLTEARTLGWGQFERPFAFQSWKKAPKLFQSESFAFNYKLDYPVQFKKMIGFDIEEKMVEVALHNYHAVETQLKKVQKKDFISVQLEAAKVDSLSHRIENQGPLWVVVNPPYGERLSESTSGGLAALAKTFCQNYNPQKMGLLYPEKEKLGKSVPKGYRVSGEVKINNGGIRCLFTILTRL